MTLSVTMYIRPNGQQVTTDISEIEDDDATFFKTRSVKISMEEDPASGYIVYADYGAVDEDGEPEEIIVFSRGRSCRDTLTELRELTERAMVP